MGALTEVEIFSCMAENLRLAAEHCDDLAVKPFKGPIYENLREELSLIEGCCKQAAFWRSDDRWLDIGLDMAKAHKLAGGWLRGYKINGVRIKIAEGEKNLCFVELAKVLRKLLEKCEGYRTDRTGRVGMIVREPIRPFMRDDRKHRVRLPFAMSPGGIIIPHGVA